MNGVKITMLAALSLILIGAFPGCTIAPDKQLVPESTPNPSATRIIPLLATATLTLQPSTSFTLEPQLSSSPTMGISPEDAAQLIPLSPSQVTVEKTANAILLKWRGTGEDVLRYEVLRRAASSKDWQPLADIEKIGDNRGLYEWKDTTIKPNITYIYGVRAVNSYGRKSEISESIAITPP